jgi:hypothetical protein
VLGVLALPALAVAGSLERAFVPVLAPLLGAVSLGLGYPALAGRRGGGLERALLGALGWCWLAVASLTLSIGTSLGIGRDARGGWTDSTSAAAHQVLAPLTDPRSIAAAATFALAAWAMGPMLRAGHFALSLVWAVLWSAGLTAALRATGEPATAVSPLVALAAAVGMILLAQREAGSSGRWRRALHPFAGRAAAARAASR